VKGKSDKSFANKPIEKDKTPDLYVLTLCIVISNKNTPICATSLAKIL
jgi:hypothetical protein